MFGRNLLPHPYSFKPMDGDSMFLHNGDTHLLDYNVSHLNSLISHSPFEKRSKLVTNLVSLTILRHTVSLALV